MYKKEYFILCSILISILAFSLVSALNQEPYLGDFKRGINITLKQSCTNSSTACTYCNITSIVSPPPNQSIVFTDILMDKNGYEFSYNFTGEKTNIYNNGKYSVYGVCDGTVWHYTFGVNPTGLGQTESRTSSLSRMIYFFFIIGIILFIGFLFVGKIWQVKATFFLLSMLFILISINFLFITLEDEVVNPKIESFLSSFTAISFLLYWGIGTGIFVIWLITFVANSIYNKKIAKQSRLSGEADWFRK
jgi:hypothetical protein